MKVFFSKLKNLKILKNLVNILWKLERRFKRLFMNHLIN